MKRQTNIQTLRLLEGLQTVDTAAEALGMTRQSTINLLSRLKKQGYVSVQGGGKLKKLYRITMRKQRKRDPGMFDILNKYSPMKLAPWYDHQVHGIYDPEEALIDAIQTGSFRTILASMRLFNHITNWSKLYRLAREKDCWQKVGALYDVAKLFFKVRKMPMRYNIQRNLNKRWAQLSQLTQRHNFPDIENRWHTHIPFNKNDIEMIT